MVRRALNPVPRLARRLGWVPTWRGVYAQYADVPASAGFEAGPWIEGTRRSIEEARRGHRLPEGDRVLLPLLVAAATSSSARILDYGGGMGLDLVLLRNALGPAAVATYTVVDLPRLAEVGRTVMPDIHFVSSLADAGGPYDIVYVRSALQYAVDPLGTLRTLLGYRAPYVLLLDLAAGDVPTFVTAQLNVPGSVIAAWFLNRGDVEAVAREAGYRVALRAPAETRSVRIDVPRAYRLARTTNLLLALPAAQ